MKHWFFLLFVKSVVLTTIQYRKKKESNKTLKIIGLTHIIN